MSESLRALILAAKGYQKVGDDGTMVRSDVRGKGKLTTVPPYSRVTLSVIDNSSAPKVLPIIWVKEYKNLDEKSQKACESAYELYCSAQRIYNVEPMTFTEWLVSPDGKEF